MAKKSVYAVRVGRKTGLFFTWAECEAQVKGFSGAEFKGFGIVSDAQAWLDEGKVATADDITSSPTPDLTELWDNTACGQDDLPPWEQPLTKDEELDAFEQALVPGLVGEYWPADAPDCFDESGYGNNVPQPGESDVAKRVLAKYDAKRIWHG